MSVSGRSRGTSLSLPARLLCYLGPPSAILTTTLASPATALLSPLAFLPSAWFFRRWRRTSGEDLEPLIWTYAAAGTVGLATTAIVQMGICKIIEPFLFRFGPSEFKEDFWKEFQRSTINGLTGKVQSTPTRS